MSSPPKTLTLQTPIVRDERTLVWLQQQPPHVKWWKWDGVVTSLSDYDRWKSLGARIVLVVATEVEGDRDAWLDRLYSVAREVTMVGLSQKVLSLKTEAYWTENYDNLMNLEDVSSYPFLGEPWRTGDGDGDGLADAVQRMALLCRYHRLVDAGSSSNRPLYGLRLEEGVRPMDLVLLTQFYRSSDKRRAQELRECLRRNVRCPWVDRIVLLTEKDESVAWASFPHAEKIQQVVVGKRLTYADVLRYVIGHLENVVVALANADIYFGEETAEVWRIQWADRMLALLRWDDLGDGAKRAKLFGPRADAQDVWMFSSESVRSRVWNFSDFEFFMGQPGCDNAFLGRMLGYRFLLSNPALSLKTYHLHNSGVRTYRASDTVRAPLYLHLAPTYLLDAKQEVVPRDAPLHHLCHESVEFEIKSSSLSNEITYCTMLEKAGRYRWEPSVENFYFEPAIPVYRWHGGGGVTPNGLVYDLYRIYTGRSSESYPYWKTSKVNVFTPMVSCPRMAAIPLPDTSAFQDWNTYVLLYLSRYLRLLETGMDAGYWLPASYQGRLSAEGWKVSEAHSVEWEEERACWADEVVGFLPGPAGSELGREDIHALRSRYPRWQAEAGREDALRCIVRLDEVLTAEWVEQLRGILPATWTVEGVGSNAAAWVGADVCLVRGGPQSAERWSCLWALPKGASLLEFQSEAEVDGECQHAAHVADLKAWVFLWYKGGSLHEQLLSMVTKWLVRRD